MKTHANKKSRLIRIGRAKQLTQGFGGLYLEVSMERQDIPA